MIDEEKSKRVRDLLLNNRPVQSRNFWPWLSPMAPNPADRKSANKFLLGCMVDFRKPTNRVWHDTKIFIECMLADPDDLWGAIAQTPENEWKTQDHKLRCSLHYYQKRHDKVWDMAQRVRKRYDGDAHKIWRGQSTEETLKRLVRLGLGPWFQE